MKSPAWREQGLTSSDGSIQFSHPPLLELDATDEQRLLYQQFIDFRTPLNNKPPTNSTPLSSRSPISTAKPRKSQDALIDAAAAVVRIAGRVGASMPISSGRKEWRQHCWHGDWQPAQRGGRRGRHGGGRHGVTGGWVGERALERAVRGSPTPR